MAYRIRSTKSVQKSVREIAREQIDKAISEISDEQIGRHETVHQVRKRCKKLRGLIRLVQSCFGDYQEENQFFRDAARQVSDVRDAKSTLECFDALLNHFQHQVDRDVFGSIRDELADRCWRITEDRVDLEKRLDKFLGQLRKARRRVDHWQVRADGFPAVEGGLLKTYRRGRKAFRTAYDSPSMENFHEWRKHVKYHWYHARLLRRIWPEMMKVPCQAGDELSNLLGDDHDLAVLRQTLLEDPEPFGSQIDLQAFLGLIARRRAELQAEAYPLGERLFAEKPPRLAARFHSYWDTWTETTKGKPRSEQELTRAQN